MAQGQTTSSEQNEDQDEEAQACLAIEASVCDSEAPGAPEAEPPGRGANKKGRGAVAVAAAAMETAAEEDRRLVARGLAELRHQSAIDVPPGSEVPPAPSAFAFADAGGVPQFTLESGPAFDFGVGQPAGVASTGGVGTRARQRRSAAVRRKG